MGIHFTKEEFAERKSKVVKELKKQKLDALLMFRQESMYWLTGYDTFGFVFFSVFNFNCQRGFGFAYKSTRPKTGTKYFYY